MAYASYPQGDSPKKSSFQENQINSTPANRLLAKSFGYMALGLAISGLVAFLTSYIFAYVLKWAGERGQIATAYSTGYFTIMIVSLVGLLVSGLVMSMVMARNKHSAWVPYILYTIFMGVFLSSFLILGIDFQTIGEAFLLTSTSFFAMFLIGYFAKGGKGMRILAMVTSLLATMILLFALFWLIKILVTGNTIGYYRYDMIMSGAILLLSVIVVAFDAYNIKRILEKAEGMKNVALYCAFTMYSDYIIIFLRVLYILLLVAGKKK